MSRSILPVLTTIKIATEYFHTDTFISFLIPGVPLRETRLLNLFTAQDGGPVWGLRSILRVVDTTVVNKYRWLAENLTPAYDDLYQKEGYSVYITISTSIFPDIYIINFLIFLNDYTQFLNFRML